MTYFEKIVDVATGEETLRPYTNEEIAKVEAAITEAKIKLETEIAKQHERAALLERLGITEDEAKLLLS